MRYITVCFAFVSMYATAGAAIWHVDNDNCPGPGSGSPADPFCLIQDAIADDEVVDGDEIIVHPGTYEELIDFSGKAIALRSSDGPEFTTIDGTSGGIGPVVACQNIDGPGVVLEGFTITGGRALNGGGMFVEQADPVIIGCRFLGNSVGAPWVPANEVRGGGLYLSQSDATVINCSFLGNAAVADTAAPSVNARGGGIYVESGSSTVVNCTFSGNSVSASTTALPGFVAHADGAGIANVSGHLIVTNCVFSGNSVSTTPPLPDSALGAGVSSTSTRTTSVANCIFFANSTGTPNQIDVSGSVTVSHSCAHMQVFAGTGNIHDLPYLVNADGVDDVFGTADDDVHLQENSPCINAGDDEAVPRDITTDFEGDDRVRHCRVDMGVDETPYIGYDCNGNGVADACDVSVIHVDDDAPPGGDGSTWAAARNDLRPVLQSLDCAIREIRVAGGTYTPGSERTDTFQLLDNVALRGGYRGSAGGGDPNDRGFESILSGDIPGDNSYHVVTGSGTDATAVLDGFTITAGVADGGDAHDRGGGMYIDGGSPTVANCTFTGNHAAFGGGMANLTASPVVTRCTFSENTAGCGGGMSNDSSDPEVADCMFIGNTADLGGGMDNVTSTPTVTNCRFIGNSSDDGGGMYNYDHGAPVVANCMFSGNTATQDGGGMRNDYADSPIITNCTFSGNSASLDGGAIANWYSSPILSNCILWGNTVQPAPEIVDEQEGTTTAAFCCIQDQDSEDGIVYEGPGNIDDDPLLLDSAGPDGVSGTGDDNLRLRYGSPCINTGLVGGPEVPETDLDGHARVLCQLMDKGPYEYGIGDVWCEGDVDTDDFARWQACATGPNNGPYGYDCAAFDFDFDGDIDLVDLAGFERAFTGSQ